jgi:hypothetical protein
MYRDTNKHTHTKPPARNIYLLLFIFSVISSSLSYFVMSHAKTQNGKTQSILRSFITALDKNAYHGIVY